jgi:hypothetical protein
MIKKIFLVFALCSLCVSCGVKDDPEYKAQSNFNKTIKLV